MKRWILLGLGAFAIGFMSSVGIAAASGPEQDAASSLDTFSVVADEADRVSVSARFANGGGRPIIGREVSFFLDTGFLGRGRLTLGSDVTDEAGEAGIGYKPAWDGTQRLVVNLAGSQGYQGTKATIEFEVTGAKDLYHPEPKSLGPLRRWVPWVTGSIAVLVWAAMAGVMWHTVGGIKAEGHRMEFGERL